jgi:hypothetical protein
MVRREPPGPLVCQLTVPPVGAQFRDAIACALTHTENSDTDRVLGSGAVWAHRARAESRASLGPLSIKRSA